MKVLFLAPTPPPTGGIARWSETVIKYCSTQPGIDLIHINIANKTRDIVNRGIFDRFIGSFLRIFKIQAQINEICKEKKCDIAHIATSAGFGLVRDFLVILHLKRKNIKVVYHLHFGRIPKIKSDNTIEYKIIKYLFKMVEVAIAMDPLTYESIKNDVSACFVPNPIERVKFNYSTNKKIIYIGYVVKEKGIEELASAWEQLTERYDEWELLIVGPYEESYVEQLKKQYQCKRVQFLGELSHENAMYELAEASIFTLPSHSEGFPYSVCEAMYCGKAIVGSNVGAIPFLLGDYCGIVCEGKNSISLRESLSALIDNEQLRKKVAYNAVEKANSTFDVEIVMQMYVKIWQGCE